MFSCFGFRSRQFRPISSSDVELRPKDGVPLNTHNHHHKSLYFGHSGSYRGSFGSFRRSSQISSGSSEFGRNDVFRKSIDLTALSGTPGLKVTDLDTNTTDVVVSRDDLLFRSFRSKGKSQKNKVSKTLPRNAKPPEFIDSVFATSSDKVENVKNSKLSELFTINNNKLPPLALEETMSGDESSPILEKSKYEVETEMRTSTPIPSEVTLLDNIIRDHEHSEQVGYEHIKEQELPSIDVSAINKVSKIPKSSGLISYAPNQLNRSLSPTDLDSYLEIHKETSNEDDTDVKNTPSSKPALEIEKTDPCKTSNTKAFPKEQMGNATEISEEKQVKPTVITKKKVDSKEIPKEQVLTSTEISEEKQVNPPEISKKKMINPTEIPKEQVVNPTNIPKEQSENVEELVKDRKSSKKSKKNENQKISNKNYNDKKSKLKYPTIFSNPFSSEKQREKLSKDKQQNDNLTIDEGKDIVDCTSQKGNVFDKKNGVIGSNGSTKLTVEKKLIPVNNSLPVLQTSKVNKNDNKKASKKEKKKKKKNDEKKSSKESRSIKEKALVPICEKEMIEIPTEVLTDDQPETNTKSESFTHVDSKIDIDNMVASDEEKNIYNELKSSDAASKIIVKHEVELYPESPKVKKDKIISPNSKVQTNSSTDNSNIKSSDSVDGGIAAKICSDDEPNAISPNATTDFENKINVQIEDPTSLVSEKDEGKISTTPHPISKTSNKNCDSRKKHKVKKCKSSNGVVPSSYTRLPIFSERKSLSLDNPSETNSECFGSDSNERKNSVVEKQFDFCDLNGNLSRASVLESQELELDSNSSKTVSKLEEEASVDEPPKSIKGPVQPKTAAELKKLEAALSAKTSEATEAQREAQQARIEAQQSARGLEALTVLVHHLTNKYSAFSNPSLKAEICDLKKCVQEKEDALECSKAALSAAQCALVEEKKLATHQEEQMKRRHQEEREELITTHQRRLEEQEEKTNFAMEDLRKEGRLEIKHRDDKHEEAMKILTEEHQKKLSEMLSVQAQELSSHQPITKSNVDEVMQELTTIHESKEAESAEKHSNELREQTKKLQDTLLSDTDHRLTAVRNYCTGLQAEIDSLKSVVEMRNSELHKLRLQVTAMEQLEKDLDALRERNRTLMAKTEDLNAQMNAKAKSERELMASNRDLSESMHKESCLNKQLRLENEELQWKLTQREQLSQSLPPMATLDLMTRSSCEAQHPRLTSPNGREQVSASPKVRRSQSTKDATHLDNKHQNGTALTPIGRATSTPLGRTNSSSDSASPPASPSMKGVVAKSNSVSFILDLDGTLPENNSLDFAQSPRLKSRGTPILTRKVLKKSPNCLSKNKVPRNTNGLKDLQPVTEKLRNERVSESSSMGEDSVDSSTDRVSPALSWTVPVMRDEKKSPTQEQIDSAIYSLHHLNQEDEYGEDSSSDSEDEMNPPDISPLVALMDSTTVSSPSDSELSRCGSQSGLTESELSSGVASPVHASDK